MEDNVQKRMKLLESKLSDLRVTNKRLIDALEVAIHRMSFDSDALKRRVGSTTELEIARRVIADARR